MLREITVEKEEYGRPHGQAVPEKALAVLKRQKHRHRLVRSVRPADTVKPTKVELTL
jgi:hypothetical protein